ncbi:carbon starvation protein [[Clostridium] sordellii]|uniref:carbon starvation CstA family protein n=1 Tax=Paraclostridium sordellii TaxID=1505 RepID=UPI0005E229A0|nr:carbon starvation protein A [Paeniclostridium sordellii]CEQ08877.1 carbon starvation protein [[Clostridium] sordellii] [Paeniclostridium sordellii]
MLSFLGSIVLLLVGYAFYGKYVEKVFGINDNESTPANTLTDGVDYIPMKWNKIFLIQFLNIAGLGPIFGAIQGALFGPAAFLWIVFGCIFAGGVHDFLSGYLSMKNKDASASELVGLYLGDKVRSVMRVFTVVLLILVGAVFMTGPAALLTTLTSLDASIWVVIIVLYYIAATVLPVDKVIGKIYPLFGAALLIMAVGVAGGLIFKGYQIPEIRLQNLHPEGQHLFPFLFITIACGAISGFHATQSPMMARCVQKESETRRVFYGAMVAEGIIALIWAAAAMTFFGGVPQLDTILAAGGPAAVVNTISTSLMGKVGGILAVLGVVVCPITSGDTAFRSARLTIADAMKIDQTSIKSRFMISIPLFVIGIALTFIDFNIVWRYFSWANQTLAMIMLWTGSVYLAKENKNHYISTIPAIFMTVVTFSYIMQAPEGFRLHAGISNIIGILAAILFTVLFSIKVKKLSNSKLEA